MHGACIKIKKYIICVNINIDFDVLLTVHLSIILVIDQLNPYRTNVENRVSS